MPDLTQESSTVFHPFDDGALTLFGRPFQGRLSREKQSDIEVLQPPAPLFMAVKFRLTRSVGFRATTKSGAGFGLFPFRSPLLRESRMISFPLLHEMFQFTE